MIDVEKIDNPYWDAVKPYVVDPPSDRYMKLVYGGNPSVGAIWQDDDRFLEAIKLRWKLVSRYAWSIPDPGALRFIHEHSRGSIVDPMAGTGYWAYLLSFSGLTVHTSDTDPPQPGHDSNMWHPDTEQFVHVARQPAWDSVEAHPDATLFLSWPPCNTYDAARTLAAYSGDRLIFIGEGRGGCTADDTFFEMLDKSWEIVAEYPMVQWAGMHDEMSVWDRCNQPGSTP